MTCDEFRAMEGEGALRGPPSVTETVALIRHMHKCDPCRALVRRLLDGMTPEHRRVLEQFADGFQHEVFKYLECDPEMNQNNLWAVPAHWLTPRDRRQP